MSTEDHPDWWRPIGGQNSQDSILERRSLIWNDDGVVDRALFPIQGTDAVYKGKFFTRGCRGMIEEILIYRTATAGGTITLRFSPHPCIGPLYTVVIPAGPANAWTGVAFEQMWNYDSLFIWVHELEAGEEWGYDAAQPYDCHVSEDGGATWADLAIRPFIRAVYTGETPGDVPVSGIVNVIEIPSVTTIHEKEVEVNVPHATATSIITIEGAGTLMQAHLYFETSVVPTPGALPGAVQYGLSLYIDGVYAYWIDNIIITQSAVATSGRCAVGEFVQITVPDPVYDWTILTLRIPFKFRRSVELRAYQSTGAAVDVLGALNVNQLS